MRLRNTGRGRRNAPFIIKNSPFFVGAVALLGMVGGGFAADLPIVPIVVAPPPPPPPVVCENHIYAGADYLRMTRQDPDATPLVSVAAPGDVLDASDFSFGWSSGIAGRAGIIFCNIGFEVGGFWISPMSSFLDDLFLGDPDVEIETNPLTDVFGVSAVTGYNETRVWGLDANVVVQLNPNVLLFAGAAFIELADILEIDVISDQTPTSFADGDGFGLYTWTAQNLMVGPQVGVRGMFGPLTPGSFFLGVDVGAGLLFNFIRNDLLVDRSALLGDLTGTDSAFSIVPMVRGAARVGFQVTSNIAITAGYQALWLGNVALAPDQVAETGDLNIPGPDTVTLGTATNDFFSHGIEIGIRLRF